MFKNLTKKPLKIIWDETSFIDTAGRSNPIFHDGVTISERDRAQVPSMIPPKGTLEDALVPKSSPYLNTQGYVSWVYTPLCGTVSELTHSLDEKACQGKTMGFFITYEVGNKKKTAQVMFKYVGPEKDTSKTASN